MRSSFPEREVLPTLSEIFMVPCYENGCLIWAAPLAAAAAKCQLGIPYVKNKTV